jgi:hypothetical protein
MILCYSDFTHTIYDYFSTLKKREIVYEFAIPLVVSVIYFRYGFPLVPAANGGISTFFNSFNSLLINVFAILVGFTIAAIAIFTTVDSSKIELLDKDSDRKIDGAIIKNYRFIYVNLIYSAFSSIVMLAFTLSSVVLSYAVKELFLTTVMVFGATHILLLSMRNITTLYFVFIDPKKKIAK